MASDTKTSKQFEWLVVIPDLPGAQEKRLAVRPTHFSNLGPLIESGKLKTGGALLNEVPQSDDTTKWDFHGSTLVCVAETKEEVMELLKNDVYSKEVWDLGNVQIWPFKCAFRNP